jgi:glycerol-3-phosphate acyltransferase PlsX
MTVVLAVDAMGGDFGPSVVVKGVSCALDSFKKATEQADSPRFIFYGNEGEIFPVLKKFPLLASCSSVEHAAVIITNQVKPLEALRHKDDSNLGKALKAVISGQANAVISAANTGAYVSLATVILGTLPGIARPAIPALIPNKRGKSIVLDLGANLECSVEQLVQFALMGEAWASTLFRKKNPKVGLLNVGSEEMKGNANVQQTAQWLHRIAKETQGSSDSVFHFYGFVEGDDIFEGTTDVIVTDGFSGNIALKAIEGAILFVFSLLKQASQQSFFFRILSFFLVPFFNYVKTVVDPRLYNGAVLLGLKRIAVKSHGGADVFSFSQAVLVALHMAQSSFSADIEQRLHLMEKIQ